MKSTLNKETEMEKFERSITIGWDNNTRLTCAISLTPTEPNFVSQNMELTINGRTNTDSFTTMHLPGMDVHQIDKIIAMLLETKEYVEAIEKLNSLQGE